MKKRQCGVAALRAALTRFEDASAPLTTAANPVLPPSSSLISRRVSAAKARVEVERSVEVLAKEVRTANAIEHLPRLEAALLGCKSASAEAHAGELHTTASELRERLARASKVCPACTCT